MTARSSLQNALWANGYNGEEAYSQELTMLAGEPSTDLQQIIKFVKYLPLTPKKDKKALQAAARAQGANKDHLDSSGVIRVVKAFIADKVVVDPIEATMLLQQIPGLSGYYKLAMGLELETFVSKGRKSIYEVWRKITLMIWDRARFAEGIIPFYREVPETSTAFAFPHLFALTGEIPLSTMTIKEYQMRCPFIQISVVSTKTISEITKEIYEVRKELEDLKVSLNAN